MTPDAVLLPLCLGISLLGVIFVAVAWHRRHGGRVIQAAGVVIVPIALYLTGLLGLVVQGAAALAHWAIRLVFNPVVWTGLALLGVAIVLWVVGGVVASRQRGRTKAAKRTGQVAAPSGQRRQSSQRTLPSKSATSATPGGGDDDFAEIEALLKKRGIE